MSAVLLADDDGPQRRRLGPVWPDGLNADGSMSVLCWCMRSEVRVSPDVIRAGQTTHCGTERCRRIDRREAAKGRLS